MHKVGHETLLCRFLVLCRDHVADSFIECVDLYQVSLINHGQGEGICIYLLRHEIGCDAVNRFENFINERSKFALLLLDKVALALLRNLDERVTGHVLYTLVGFMHEFKELVDNGLQKLPMGLQEPRILTNRVHDVGCHDSLVIFATLSLTQAKQLLDHRHQETLFSLLIHSTRNGTDCPAELVEILPRPLTTIHLEGKKQGQQLWIFSSSHSSFKLPGGQAFQS